MDRIQQTLCDFIAGSRFEDLAPGQVLAAKHALVGAIAEMRQRAGRGCAARDLAQRWPQPGATLIGTQAQAEADLSVLANAAGAGEAVAVVAAVIAAAELGAANGREVLLALALAEAVRRAIEPLLGAGFCSSNAVCLAAAAGAARALALPPEQIAEALGLAAVTDAVLDQPDPSWRAMAPAMAARAGLFAALTARAGMQGPVRPFEGKTGWFALLAPGRPLPEPLILTLPDLPEAATLGGGAPAGDPVLDRLHRAEDLDHFTPVLAALA